MGESDEKAAGEKKVMLDLQKLAGQFPLISNHLRREAVAGKERLAQAQQLLQGAQDRLGDLCQQRYIYEDQLIFTTAIPIEPLTTAQAIAPPPSAHTIFATDGSQLAPSHHEIAYCYLLNIGRVMLHYGQSLHPLLDSQPQVFYRAEDLYEAKRWGIRAEDWMNYRRTAFEMMQLAEMACRWVRPPGPHDGPNLAMADGSLCYWFLETLPQEARETILQPVLQAWCDLQESGIPWVGYISASRSVEAIHFLRLQACPFDAPQCAQHCGDRNDGEYPCQKMNPLRDATLWRHLLQPGERSGLWRTTSRILQHYPPEHQVYFCYLHVGTEVARVELPAWIAQDSARLEQVLGILLAQVHKGYGYPVGLAEAHNQAVIRSSDRARFFTLLEQHMVRQGLKNVGISYKESRKRNSIA